MTMTRKKVDVIGLVLTSSVALIATVVLILDFAWATFFGVLFVFVLVFLSWFLVRRSKPVDHTHPNGHRIDICEGCDPVCYAKDGAPLSFRDWYTTTRGDTAEELARIIVHAPIWRIQELEKQHAEYLLHPKFRNYPKP